MQQELTTASTHAFTWLDLNDPSQDELNQVAEQYGLYYTVIKDSMEPDHLPKFETIGPVNFIITRIYNPDKNTDADTIQELSDKIAIFYSNEFIITVHRMAQPVLEQIKNKFVDPGHCQTTAELTIRIVRWVLNSYIDPGLALATQLDNYEEALFLSNPSKQVLEKLYYLKRKASSAKRILTLTEDILHSLQRSEGESPVLQDTQDLHLKARTIYEQLEEAATHLLSIYLSMASQRTNEVMRVLTIFSAFFLPLTFIAGIYGMNFEYMPELRWHLGYPGILLLMVVVALCIYIWFKRKGWL
ncbi:MAG: magnesium transporter CorA [Cytophagaceae bacterium]|nr:MAG: magnesium transporter CorA [Cytophagaceae bacterium]